MSGDRRRDGGAMTYAAKPNFAGRVGEGFEPVTFNGRVLPRGFDLASIDWSRVRQADVTRHPAPSGGQPALDIVTWPE